MDTHELTTGQLFFDDALVAKILSLAEYNRAAVQTELNDDFIFDGENLITDISYVNEDSIESGIEAKIILKIDASEYVNDEFTDSDSEAEFDQ
ncbi:protein of unknown function [Taphrina deformans PYCC 5710]|uniref:Uncharacterized protein n=1 Tax=Taphrina deformans (strain PYCC 5710 / ATCC 11124 / CBS 356.35 / IMI 108563 / JCM 9778 / NBRC 8474) TaxID=1097556 RepID=R4X905_TAPDE|nr:protein of unknown function [Taphrina deformans PYCC 5710]|eukprot:CCG82154.1 protein of unknown function [Taphrina deformans PYCC 5710]